MGNCAHRVERMFCGLCGPWNTSKPGQVGAEGPDGYPMDNGWQTSLWEWEGEGRDEEEVAFG